MTRNSVREDKREMLLDAALRVFAVKGYHGATVKDIVEAAQVATGTFYLYFPSKQSAFLALIDRLYQEAMAAVKKAREEREGVIGKLEASLETAIRFFGQCPEIARLILLQAPGADPIFDHKLAEIHGGLTYLVREDLDEAVAQGVISPLDTKVAARALVGTVYEVMTGWLREGDPPSLEEALPTLLAYNRRGLGVKDL